MKKKKKCKYRNVEDQLINNRITWLCTGSRNAQRYTHKEGFKQEIRRKIRYIGYERCSAKGRKNTGETTWLLDDARRKQKCLRR
jgi:hypothetical protein